MTTKRTFEDVIRSIQKKHPEWTRKHCERVARTIQKREKKR